jgi:peptidoglycan/LPS O-acetylase OafA/YrhL
MELSESTRTTSRDGGLDALRFAAAVGVVLLHASAPYLVWRMPGLTWPVFDQPSTIANGLGWTIELFIMPLFLLIAGFLTPGILQRHGAWGFVKHRFVRLIKPLMVGAILILPMDLYIWLAGWLIEGHIAPRKIRSLKFDGNIDRDLWGFSHLWFLQYLFLYGILWSTASTIAQRWRGQPGHQSEHQRRRPSADKNGAWQFSVRLIALGMAGWIVLTMRPEVVFGFQHAFLPVPSKWIYSGTFFVGGILLFSNHAAIDLCRRRWPVWLLVGGVAAGIALLQAGRLLTGDVSLTTRCSLAAATVVSAWGISFAALGWALGSQLQSTRPLRYLAAASFWMYLVHHPIVGLAHINLKVLVPQWAPSIKMGIAATVAIVFSLLTFECFVRRWPLGSWLVTPREFLRGSALPTDQVVAGNIAANEMPNIAPVSSQSSPQRQPLRQASA